MNKNNLKYKLAIISIVIFYSILVFYKIGSKSVPVTYWEPIDKNNIFEVKFENPLYIKKIIFYFGYGSGKLQVGIDAVNNDLKIVEVANKSFYNTSIIMINKTVNKIIVSINEPKVRINEIAFLDRNDKIVSKDNFRYKYLRKGRICGELMNLFDEQSVIPTSQSFVFNSYYDFDEIYHARTAYEFAYNLPPYDLVHPPLGKFIIMLGIKLWGPTPFGWRFFNAVFGIMNLVLLYILLFVLFKKETLALLGTGLFALDFMNYTMARWANLDTYTVFFVLLVYLFALKAFRETDNLEINKRKFYIFSLMTGVSLGLAFSCKWNTLYPLIPLPFFLAYKLLKDKTYSNRMKYLKNKIVYRKEKIIMLINSLLVAVISASMVYFIVYLPLTVKSSNLLKEFIFHQKHILGYHSGLNATHPFSSRWYEWLILKKPVWIFLDSSLPSYKKSVVVIMGNPVICYIGLLAVVSNILILLCKKENSEEAKLPLLGYVFAVLPWTFISRVTFLYHYYLAIPFLIMCIVVMYKNFKWLQKKYLFGALIIASFIFFILYYPIISGVPVMSSYIERLKIFNSWVF
jgi:predicted membrane-bound dolichyl-phosphate-mannose-protein mannosyltransferase